MKATIEANLCVGCGTCVALCPTCFKMNAQGKSEVIGEGDCVKAAADSCPEGAITVSE